MASRMNYRLSVAQSLATGCPAVIDPNANGAPVGRLEVLGILGKEFSTVVSALGEPVSFDYYPETSATHVASEREFVLWRPAYSKATFAAQGVASVTCSFTREGVYASSVDALRGGGFRLDGVDIRLLSKPKDWRTALELAGLDSKGAMHAAGFTRTHSEITGVPGLGSDHQVVYGGNDEMGYSLHIHKND